MADKQSVRCYNRGRRQVTYKLLLLLLKTIAVGLPYLGPVYNNLWTLNVCNLLFYGQGFLLHVWCYTCLESRLISVNSVISRSNNTS